MLKVDKDGCVIVKGTQIIIMAELSTLIRHIMDLGAMDKDDLNEVIRIATMTKEECHEEAKRVFEEHQDTLADVLTDALAEYFAD